MYSKFSCFFLPFLLLTTCLVAQVPKDATIPVTATFTTNPAGSVTISWPNPAASSLIVLRRAKTSPPNLWTSLLNVNNSTQTTLTDNLVTVGQVYEYAVQRTVNNVTSYGYAHVALNAPVVDNRGKIIFLVDSLLMGPLGNEVDQLKLDMMGEGWTVVQHIIGTGATVQSIKNQIVANYNTDPFNTKMVFLLGALPVPYSGNTAWDLQVNHKGAWPSDSYYGDMNGIWTDLSVNNVTATRPANDNVPGDKKFDQDLIPTAVELAVGRVDFRRLTPATFGISQVELYRRYLNKDHAWRTKQYTVANKAIVDDNSGYANGEAFAANAYRNAYPLIGAANVVEGDFFTPNAGGYVFGFGAGTGTYTSIAGVGSSADFAGSTVNVAFSMFYGDYLGDWDSETDPFLPSALASRGGILTAVQAGRPHVFYHALASGETIGFCTRETQNAQYNTGFLPSYGESGTHVSLLGDPTLRANVVAPPTNLTVSGQCGTVTLNWSAPAAGAPGGYHVYRGPERNGIYDRLTAVPITATTFADNSAPGDTLYYQVRAVAQITTPGGGSYLNASVSTAASLIFAPSGVPVVTLTGGTLTCTAVTVTLTGVNAPNTAIWTGPGGFTSNQNNPAVTAGGVYSATVTAANGCTTVSEVAVLIDTFIPTFTIPAFPPLSCLMPCGVVNLPETPGYQVVLNGQLLVSGVNYNVCDTGLYTVILRSLANGCEDIYTATVVEDFTPPGATASVLVTACNAPFQLLGNSPTSGVVYGWNGPEEYVALEQNPIGIDPGIYQLIVRNPVNGCTSTASVTISDPGTPSASASGATLTCGQQSAVIEGSSTTPGVAFSWTGPGGFTSNQQNPTVTLPGTYILTVTTTSGCTNSAITVVSSNAVLPDATATGAILACNQTSTTIQGNSTSSGATFGWTGPNGFTSSLQNPSVGVAGTYILTVTAVNGCTATASAVVSNNAAGPNATATGATLLCNQPSVPIQGNSTTQGVVFAWTGPNGFTASVQNPTVSLAGTYILTVTGPNGCTSTASAVVIADTNLPNVTASGTTLTCANPAPEVPIQGNSTTAGATYAWTGPNGFTSTLKNPPATTPGTYLLVVTAPNGCTNTATAILNIDVNSPNASAAGATLACNPASVSIQGTSTTPEVAFSWTGPAGFSSNQQNPTVTLAGTYVLTVTATNGCTSTASAVVSSNVAAPNATALGAELSCNQIAVVIQGNSTTPGATFTWAGPGGFASTLQNPTVTLTGTYVLTVTATNGCTGTATAVVSSNANVPNATAVGVTLTCSQPTAIIQGNSTTAGVGYSWTGPNGFVSNEQSPTVSLAGTYVLTVTAANGCTTTASAVVNSNTVAPSASATGATITCSQTSVTIQGNSVISGASFAWTGPGGFTSNQKNPTVTVPGTYVLTVTASNGCTSTASAVVGTNTTAPNASANGTVLTCNQPSGVIQGNSTTAGVGYTWTGPGGFTSNQQNTSVTLPGTYVLTVTALANGCTSTASSVVSVDASVPNISVSGTTVTCSQPMGTIQGNSTSTGATYSWTGPGGFTATQANPAVTVAGNYTLVVTVPNGCTSSAVAEVIADVALPNIFVPQPEVLDCNTPCALVQATSTTPGTTPVMEEYCQPGTYTLVLTAPNGCTNSKSFEVVEAPPLELAISGALVDCDGVNTISASATGGTAPYQYLWSTGDTTATITVAPGTVGVVEVVITDGGGCSIQSTSVTIIPATPIEVGAVIVNESAVGLQNGSVVLSVQGGDCVTYDYLWNTGATTSALVNLPAGTYTATVTCSATGCTAVITATVSTTIGTEDVAFWKNIRLSPNPANDQALLTVHLSEATALRIKVVDATGRVVLNLPETTLLEGSLPLDLSHCPPGMYTVLLSTKNEVTMRKLVVVRD